jgi:phage recombination protein Bet
MLCGMSKRRYDPFQKQWEEDVEQTGGKPRGWWSNTEYSLKYQREEERFYRQSEVSPAMKAALVALDQHIQKQKERERMQTQITVQAETTSSSLAVKLGLSETQLDLVKRTVAKNATPDELELFFYRCKELQLNPLMPGQVYFLKFGSAPGTVIVGLDGFRARALRTGKHAGTKRGVIRNAKGECIGGWADVYRKDWEHPAHIEVSLAEYADPRKQTWKTMPETMIQKVAEVAALRMAFPEELGGVYTSEEMDRQGDTTVMQAETHQRTNLKPSQAQIARLFAIGKSNGFTTDEIKEILLKDYGHDSTKDLTIDEYNDLCSKLEAKTIAQEPKPAPQPTEPEPPKPLAAERQELPWEKYLDDPMMVK